VRAVDARNAFIMNRLLQEITRSGTAAKAQAVLQRPDLYGKTGTTNDAVDTWFAGFQPTVAAVVWMGYDTPRSLGDRETGGGLSLPIWISYMETALRGVAVSEPEAPPGVVNSGGEWYYEEYSRGSGISSLAGSGGGSSWRARSGGSYARNGGGARRQDSNTAPRSEASGAPDDRPANAEGPAPTRAPEPPPEERRGILDLFRN